MVFQYLFLLYIASIGFINSPVWAQNSQCIHSGQLAWDRPDTKYWVDFTRHLAVDAASKNLKGFCEWNRMDRSASGLIKNSDYRYEEGAEGKLNEYRIGKTVGDRDKSAQELIVNVSRQDPWRASMGGSPSIKNKAHSYFFEACRSDLATSCAGKLAKLLSADDYIGNYDVPKYKQEEAFDVPTPKLLAGCGYLVGVSARSCVRASKDLMKTLAIHKGPGTDNITGVPLISESLSNQATTAALKRVATSLWSKIGKKSFMPQDNIFSDLVRELEVDGMNALQAKKEATKILGAIATGGPNFAGRIKYDDARMFPLSCTPPNSCNLNGVYMAAIAEGMALADTIKMAAESPSQYSLPENVNFPCDSGKNYHFWMSAALTDRLIDAGHPPSAARASVYLSEIGYHLNSSEYSTRKPAGVLAMPRYGSVENGLRIDLNLAAAGASFGAKVGSNDSMATIDIKEGFLETLRAGNSTPAREDEKFEGILGDELRVLEWVGRTGAKTAFSTYD